jgi:hypothetical protein
VQSHTKEKFLMIKSLLKRKNAFYHSFYFIHLGTKQFHSHLWPSRVML